MAAEPSTGSCDKQKAFQASNLNVEEVNEILQNCKSEESDREHTQTVGNI
jgi:hypothetical protein